MDHQHPGLVGAESRAKRLIPLVTLLLAATNVAVHLAAVVSDLDPLQASLRPSALASGEWWRLATASFLHADLGHLAFNTVLLLDLGILVERLVGHWRTLALYLGGGLAGSLGSLIAYPENVDRVGASGAIFGLAGAALVLLLKARRGDVPVKASRALRGVLGVAAANIVYGYVSEGVDNGAHVGGLLFGLLSASLLFSWEARGVRRFAEGIVILVIAAAGVGLSSPAFIRVAPEREKALVPEEAAEPSQALLEEQFEPRVDQEPAPPPPDPVLLELASMADRARRFGTLDCSRLSRHRVMTWEQCEAFRSVITAGLTRGHRKDMLAALAMQGYVQLRGQVVAAVDSNVFEVTVQRQHSPYRRALLVTRSFGYTTTGRYRIWVQKVGKEFITTKRGDHQSWPVFEENEVGRVYTLMRKAPAGEETSEAASLLAAALIASVAVERKALIDE